MDIPGIDLMPWPVPSALLLLFAWSAAVVVYRTAPHREVNRSLAVVLVLEGMVMGFSAGWNQLVEGPEVSYVLVVLGTMAVAAAPYQYLAFLASAFDVPPVRPFRGATARTILATLSVATATLVLARPQWFVTELYRVEWGTWNFQYRRGGLFLARLQALAAAYGLLAAVWASVRTPPGTVARGRALLVAMAFGIRDTFVAVILILYPLVRPIPFWGDFIYNPAQGAIYLLYVSLLTYGILRSQILDIELKVKFALTQSVAGALLAVAFFVLSESIEALLPVQGLIPGLLAAGLVVLVLRPIYRVVRGMMERLMPGVERSSAYITTRRAEIYRAALEGAAEDGRITSAEQAILERLREQLGLEDHDARLLEMEVAAAGLPESPHQSFRAPEPRD
ncbi:MAG: hypothetical protein P8177_05035 [Gemmatimonadota bacterium]